MKQSILGFDQEASVKLGLTIKDLLLLQYITCAISSDTMKSVSDENGSEYVWLQRAKIIEDLPILNVKERELNYSINRLKELGLLNTKDLRESGVRGSRIYYGVTEKCKELMCEEMSSNAVNARVSTLPAKNCNQSNDAEDMNAKNCNQSDTLPAKNCNQNTQLGAKNCTSDNTITSKTIINNFTNVKLLGKSSISPATSSENIQPKRRVLVPTDNPVSNKPVRKKNLFDNCMDEINKFTDDEEIRELLKTYLPIRLARKDIVINLPTFRGILKTLSRVAVTREDKIKSIQQSIDRQYPTFYEPHKYNNYNNRKKFAEGKNGLKTIQANTEDDVGEVF